jgi:hypothetical protein
MKYLVLLLPILMMGCSMIPTTGVNREYDVRVYIQHNTGPVELSIPMTVDAMSDTKQDTSGEARVTPDVKLQLTQPGSTGAMSGADSILKDTVSRFQSILKKDAEQKAIEQLPVTPPVMVPVPNPPAAVDPIYPDKLTTEEGVFWGRPNGDRPQWYFSKDFKEYPKTILLNIPGCYENTVINHNGIRYDVGNLVFKQSDVANRHMVIVAPQSCKSDTASISY